MAPDQAERRAADDPRSAGQGAVLVLVQRGLQTLGGVAFAAIVPRTLGPDVFGRYAFLISVALLFALVGGLGLNNATARYLPPLVARGEWDRVRRLVGNLLTVRMVSGAAAAGLYLMIGAFGWRDFGWPVLVIMAAAVWMSGVNSFVFSLFLGLHRADLWATGETLWRWLLLALVLPGFYLGGLLGVALALLATEVCLLTIGICRIGLRPAPADFRPDRALLRPYLGFSLTFMAAELLLVAFEQGGEVLVRAFSDYVQVGYFGLAHSLYVAAAKTLTQVTMAFVPMLSTSFEEGRTGALSAWAGQVSRYLAIAAVLAVFGSVLLGPTVVRVLLGAAYQPVADNLALLSAALLPLTLAGAPAALTVVQERPRPMLIAAAARLLVFCIVAPPAVARWGSLGACLAMLVAVVVHSVCLTWSLRGLIGVSLRHWLGPVALGACWLPLVWCRSSPLADALLYLLFLVTYGGGLLLTGLVKPLEVSSMAALLRRSAVRRGWPAVGGP